MAQRIEVRGNGPQPRRINDIVAELVRGGLIAYPTDSGYALGWRANNRKAAERVVRLRRIEGQHHFTYLCRSISDVSRFAKVSNWAHRLVRQLTPGPYTFVLPATSHVPRNHKNKRPATIGIRIPDHAVVQAILEAIDEPILSSSLIVPDMEEEIYDQEDLYDAVHQDIDLFVDAGYCPLEPTTLLDLTGTEPVVLRMGQGVVDF
ncbi:MAG: threonylcarbamoyl-AMP synthase [Xanthomonadales bacterium]|nr:threonylcarbamoyl-AMP synthase [Gammaproteobacteria bacterium]MBT8051504.1 threonylcarbamoyl-AMP synthase [Gammaproteobacteria bacterium]MBT8056391.1 threonylcarbamoyl-AMP synthase [Gammaproteobacteria bacterium]NNJ80291.1 threonylcarbamoyl-AMP synthase [Xanthomonadales bacterium]NNL04241.1 threonylcarbamoyl-AMP synthase [Xanthomonadales bacterium]